MSSPSISRSTTQSNTSEDSRRATVSPPRDVTGLVSKEGEHPFSCGAFGDVYKGTWRESRFSLSKKTVAIKVIRPFLAEGKEREKFARRLNREIGIWQKLTHDNILPFIGIATNFGKLPSPISLWMPNVGTVTRYLRTRREVNRLSFLLGIAEGLSYLHNNDPQIIHGDLKADNILVSELGTPCLADFGLSRVLDDDPFWKTNASTASGTYRWMSPELLRGQQDLSVESDVYAYAMTSLEIMTGNVPFGNIRQEAVINLVANEDRRPERPDNAEITDEIWSLWEMCWQTDPSVRPEMLEVLEVVKHFEARPRPLRLLSIGTACRLCNALNPDEWIDVDGGGVRVVCALHMLKSMMEKIGSDAKPCEYFDMIAGSGTGG
ncbi:kinase-like protein [Sistotremastrum suecicum HHB10207 ss-3]|uniref:Kinase-like protein n=1 Tax=Sistotremastrum suecicum HHB10207 ss-3 TaxID=1314776 RepID=A0A165WVF3_9AGAM|nr:kinase-like protein [Sistotremastrum suecicum HHB10207 ss-3]